MKTHYIAVGIACTVEALLVAGMLFGHKVDLNDLIGVHKTLRDICFALWAPTIPFWFALESMLFAPQEGSTDYQQFVKYQRVGQYVAAFIASIVGIVIGVQTSTQKIPPAQPPAAVSQTVQSSAN